MTALDLFHFLYNLTYFFLASQGVFYLLCFSRVFGDSSPADFIRMRQKAAPILEPRLSVLYYSCLITGAVTVALSITEYRSTPTILILTSYLLLITDVVLAKRFNIPVNKVIETVNADTIGSLEAATMQRTWLIWITVRGRILIAGFTLLLLHFLFI